MRAADREIVYVEPAGELDLACVAPLRAQLGELIDAGFAHLVIDLRQTEFLDVSVLGLLLALNADAIWHPQAPTDAPDLVRHGA